MTLTIDLITWLERGKEGPLILDFASRGMHPWREEIIDIWDNIRSRSWSYISPFVRKTEEREWKERLDDLRIIGLIDDRIWNKALAVISSNPESDEKGQQFPLLSLEFFEKGWESEPTINFFFMIPPGRPSDSTIILPSKTIEHLRNEIRQHGDEGEDFIFYHVSEARDLKRDGLDQLTETYSNGRERRIDNQNLQHPIIWMRFGRDPGPFEWVNFYLDCSNTRSGDKSVRIVIPRILLEIIPYWHSREDIHFTPVYINQKNAYASDFSSIVEWNGVYTRDFKNLLRRIGERVPRGIDDGAGVFLHVGHVYEEYLSILRLTQRHRLSFSPGISKKNDHPVKYALLRTLSHELGHHLFQIPYSYSPKRTFVSEGYAQWFSNLFCMEELKENATINGYPNNQPFVPFSDLSAFIFYYSFCQGREYSAYRFMNIFRHEDEFRDVMDVSFDGAQNPSLVRDSWSDLLNKSQNRILHSSEVLLHALQIDHQAIRGFYEGLGLAYPPSEIIDPSKNCYTSRNIRRHIQSDILFILYNDGQDPRDLIPIEDRSDDEIVAAFRHASSRHGWSEQDILLDRVAEHLGFPKGIRAIRDVLRSRMRTSVRRGVIKRKADLVKIATPRMDDYLLDFLADVVRFRMRTGQRRKREEIIHDVARHLGFTKIQPSIRRAVERAMKDGVKRHLLARDGDYLIRKR